MPLHSLAALTCCVQYGHLRCCMVCACMILSVQAEHMTRWPQGTRAKFRSGGPSMHITHSSGPASTHWTLLKVLPRMRGPAGHKTSPRDRTLATHQMTYSAAPLHCSCSPNACAHAHAHAFEGRLHVLLFQLWQPHLAAPAPAVVQPSHAPLAAAVWPDLAPSLQHPFPPQLPALSRSREKPNETGDTRDSKAAGTLVASCMQFAACARGCRVALHCRYLVQPRRCNSTNIA
jgi:hypothetical protein